MGGTEIKTRYPYTGEIPKLFLAVLSDTPVHSSEDTQENDYDKDDDNFKKSFPALFCFHGVEISFNVWIRK